MADFLHFELKSQQAQGLSVKLFLVSTELSQLLEPSSELGPLHWLVSFGLGLSLELLKIPHLLTGRFLGNLRSK